MNNNSKQLSIVEESNKHKIQSIQGIQVTILDQHSVYRNLLD